MTFRASYIFIASMDVEPEKEDLFNEVYDREHVPNLLQVPGVISVTRFTAEPFTLSLGGKERRIGVEGQPRHSAVYEIESPGVLVSREWAAAVEAGRWPTEVRPYTSNRHHVLLKAT
jgi:hypothetical protein